MADALASKPEKSLAQPPGITAVRIDPRTGLLARPGESDAIFEVFANDTVPKTETSDSAAAPIEESSVTNGSRNSSDDSDTEVKPLF
jgi:penicillin-binding protein 1A